jgi:hypothetical protein
MAKPTEVLLMLCPGVEWSLDGSNFDDIDWLGKNAPITKAEFEAGFAQYDTWKAEQDSAKAQAKAVLLERLGLTQEEFNTLIA